MISRSDTEDICFVDIDHKTSASYVGTHVDAVFMSSLTWLHTRQYFVWLFSRCTTTRRDGSMTHGRVAWMASTRRARVEDDGDEGEDARVM